ncbi:MAG: HDIG domain-containing protein [Armatimonadota bacterium]|nr:HDIG domain-containing protein [Armatimonadota bacterium]MDR5697191.1 HDIG domain-containing protein [Armatimonadota bacterium]
MVLRGRTRRLLIFVTLVLALAAVGALQYLPPRVTLREGMVSPYDVTAPRTLEYVNQERTEALRQEAASAIRPIYRLDVAVTAQTERSVRQFFESILALRADRSISDAERRQRFARLGLQNEALAAAQTLSREEIVAVREATLAALHRTLDRGVRPEEVPAAQAQARDLLRDAQLPAGPSSALARFAVARFLRPNLLVDEAATRQARDAARASVEPVRERILRDEVIVRRGDVVSAEQIRKLQALGLASSPMRWDMLAGMVLFMALVVGIAAVYLRKYQPEIWSNDRRLVLLALIVLVMVLATRIIATRLSGFLVPTAAATMLITILLNPRVASFTGGVLAILTGVVGGNDMRLAAVAYVGALVGVFSMRRVQHRTDLAYAGLLVAAANVGVILSVSLIVGATPAQTAMDVGLGVLNGLLAGILAIGALPYLEDLFGLVTPIKLLELSNPSHPLLRRLQLEAPGTYHHTVMVANLAEAAAEAVGADALLTRVGTYYHDVGKLRRPAFFVENQIGGAPNPHEKMSPSLSALTLAAHVRDGLEYARQHRIPKAIADFIPEHHGTSLMTYFYHRASERADGRVEPEAYRYEGPKPQSKETAIVMLADAVEAAVRSLSNPTPDRIREVVRRIIRERLEDGQLDECDLTFRDLDRIAQTFTRMLTSMFHPRIEYPEVSLEAHRRAAQRRSGSQPAQERQSR